MTLIVETMEERKTSEGLESLRRILSSMYEATPGEEEQEVFPSKQEKLERAAFLMISGW